MSTSSTPTSPKTPVVSALNTTKEAVNKLYEFRDHYFENHDVNRASNRNSDIAEQLKKTLTILEDNKADCEKEDRSGYYLQYGRALNIVPQFDPLAHEALAKAVKLDFRLADAWNELGECYWKKGDMEGAKNCFEGPLQRAPNKVSLRSLSMVLRQLSGTKDEKQKNVLDGISRAKEAVNLDVNDGTSWLVLGNAYLTSFFTLGQNPKLLKQSMAAYQQAMRDEVAKNNPDLHYNKAIALKYEEDYQQALESLERALVLDPSWSEPKQKKQDLLSYLQKVDGLVKNKGHLKTKKLQGFVDSLQKPTKELGPYAGGKYSGPNGQSVILTYVPVSKLVDGINAEKVVLGRVVCNVTGDDPVPFTFCMVDHESTCFSVTVYNLAQGQGVIIGDSVAIPEPFVQLVKIQNGDNSITYQNIRVDSPVVLVINCKKVGLDKHAPSSIGVQALSR